MYKFYSSIVFLLGFIGSLQSQELLTDVSSCRANHKREIPKLFDPVRAHVGAAYDVKYVRAFWSVDPDTIYISGNVCTHFSVKESGFNIFEIELNDTLSIDSVIFHDERMDYERPGNHLLRIHLSQELPLESQDSLIIYYHGYPGQTSAFTRHTHQSGSTLWSLSEPYGTKDWWPCKNHLSDKIDSIDIYIECPTSVKAGSNGVLKEIMENGNKHVYHWKHNYPIPAYLISIAVADYAEWTNTFDVGDVEVPMLNYVYPHDSAFARKTIEEFLPVMEWLNDIFIPYPYADEKYGHTQMGRGGGMEHTTMTTMGTWSWMVLVHEAVHQWFGDYITCGSWQDIWLNEGFATYFTGVAIENTYEPYWWNLWKKQTVESITSKTGGSVFVYDTTEVSRVFSDRLTYYKSARVLHLLRVLMGDEHFYEGIRNYLNDPILKFNYAHTNDLQYHFENAYGDDLTWFFDDWIYGEGYPIYNLQAIQLNDEVVRVKLEQTTSHPSVDFFEFPVSIKFKNMEHDTTVSVFHRYSGQEADFHIGFVADSVFFDPDNDLISKNNQVSFSVDEPVFVDLGVYPVPANDRLVIKTGSVACDRIELLNSEGVLIEMWESIKAFEYIDYEVSHLSSAVYFVRFAAKNKSSVIKINVIH